ncbi:MAG: AAA family ATPase [Actinobacteria bacterium]|nr:AAA family ATPase [Actinomycetota bacterium]
MYLKNIILKGFKSFSNKSLLIFQPGISVIVGPNGSGKSNIADAVSWVLGEQSPKSLRGNSMEDVIFRSKNEELATAEVSLTFDNSDKVIPLEFKEVKITRRVFSKGGSEYFINSSPCRLMDIQEMIADSGIGKGLYTIVNQGQINEIAVLKPIDRKMVIEELIGISKHKIRRDKSKGRLFKVKDDIDRIKDLMQEVKRTMDPLEIEAKKAQRYFEIYNSLKKEEISLFIRQLNDLNKNWDDENNKCERNSNRINEISDKLESTKNEKDKNEMSISDKENRFNNLKNKFNDFNQKEAELNNLFSIAESKINVFKTLYNMFNLEFYGNGINDRNTENVKNEAAAKLKEIKLETILNKIKSIEKLLEDLLSKIKKFDIKKEFIIEVKKYGDLIKEELSSIQMLIRKHEIDNGKIDNKLETKDRIKKIKNIKIFCKNSLTKAIKISSILSKFLINSKLIKNKFYPEFNKLQDELKNNHKKIDDLGNKIIKLNYSKTDLENSIYKSNLIKDQIKEKVKDITNNIIDNYNLSLDVILKNYKQSSDLKGSHVAVRKLKNQLRNYGSINPNAAIEYKRIKERYEFLKIQKIDLVESKKSLEELVENINNKIVNLFLKKFDDINKTFNYYFKILFPLGEGEMQLFNNNSDYDEMGIELKVDIGNNKFVPISLLSGGEKSLVSIAFLFSIFSINFSPFYIFDEIDATLDDVNLNRFIAFIKKFGEKQQIILITHQKRTMKIADTIYGITMQSNGVSKIISEKIGNNYAKIN